MKNKLLFCAKSLLFSYILSGILLLLLAFLLFQFQLSEGIIAICVTLLYILSTFFCGFVTGKKVESKKFLWGLMMGATYFVLLILFSLIFHHTFQSTGNNFFLVLLLCCASGMLGGMLS